MHQRIYHIPHQGMASLSGREVSETETNAESLNHRHGNELDQNDEILDEELQRLFQDCEDFITKLEMEEKSELSKSTEQPNREPKWRRMKNVVKMVTKLNKRSSKVLQQSNPKTEVQDTEDDMERKSEESPIKQTDKNDFVRLDSDVARKLAFLRKEECNEAGGTVWDCEICLSLFILHLRLTHDIYHESPRCLLTDVQDDL